METGNTSNVGVREFEQLCQVSNAEAISLVELVIRFLYPVYGDNNIDDHDSIGWFKINY